MSTVLATTAAVRRAFQSDGSGEEGMLSVQASAWDEGELLMMSTWGILRQALQGAGQAVQSMLVVTVT